MNVLDARRGGRGGLTEASDTVSFSSKERASRLVKTEGEKKEEKREEILYSIALQRPPKDFIELSFPTQFP